MKSKQTKNRKTRVIFITRDFLEYVLLVGKFFSSLACLIKLARSAYFNNQQLVSMHITTLNSNSALLSELHLGDVQEKLGI